MKNATSIINNIKQSKEAKTVQTINPPVYRGSTVLFKNYHDLALASKGEYEGCTYGTDRLPTQRIFEEAVRDLEGGCLTRSFQSGISAITNTLLAFTKSGDHILVCDNIYGPTRHFCNTVLSKFNVEVTYIPSSAGDDISGYIKPSTRMIFLESPGSNTFEIQDIPAITKIAKNKGIITVLDNTWATPIFLNPFDLGVDISIQSVTKYMSGHSDLLSGTVTVNETYAETFDTYYRTVEIYSSQEDCYLALRGLATLTVRLKQHERSALEAARWLESLDFIEHVLHPALPSHPEHNIWKRDFSGSSGLFAFTVKETLSEEKTACFVDSLELFGLGYSWGGFKSLITAGKYKRSNKSRYTGKTLIRLNMGLEDISDLINDLENGFKSILLM